MHSTTTLYNEILAGDHRTEVKAEINGTIYGIDTIVSMQTSRAVFGTGSPTIGLAPSSEINLRLRTSTSVIARMAKIQPYFRIVNDAGQRSEWIPKGTYYLDTRKENNDGTLSLTGNDSMLMAERTQPWSDLEWPARDIDSVSEIAEILNITVDAKTTALMTQAYRIPMPVSYTMRETLQYIAALYGGSFIISERNTLQLVCIWDRKSVSQADLVLDATTNGCMQRLETERAFPACSGVRFVKEDGTEVFYGSTSGYVFEIKCPWATQTAAVNLYQHLNGFAYRPYRAEAACINLSAELGDTVSVNGLSTGLYEYDVNYDSMSAADIGCPGEESLDHEYPYQSSTDRAFVRKMDGFQSELTQQASQIAAKVSRTGGDPRSFAWYLDADKFFLMSNEHQVMLVDDEGLTVNGTVNATAGNIGGCTIENGTLHVANANIDNLNAGKITTGTLPTGRIGTSSITGAKIADYTLASTHMSDGSAVNRVIGENAVSYGKTSFQPTLDQVGTNTANIDTLYGYFTGSAHFQNCQIDGVFIFGGKYIGTTQKTIDGRTLYYLEWRDP